MKELCPWPPPGRRGHDQGPWGRVQQGGARAGSRGFAGLGMDLLAARGRGARAAAGVRDLHAQDEGVASDACVVDQHRHLPPIDVSVRTRGPPQSSPQALAGTSRHSHTAESKAVVTKQALQTHADGSRWTAAARSHGYRQGGA